MNKLITWGGATVVGAIGAAAAFFLDPKSGPKRRKAAAAKGATIAPRARAHVSTMVAGAKGRGGKPAGRRKGSPVGGDEMVAAAVRGELAARYNDVAPAVGVRVHRGRVTLRGEVPDLELIGSVAHAVEGVEGVSEVYNLLRLETRP